jgi:hypothetical protein
MTIPGSGGRILAACAAAVMVACAAASTAVAAPDLTVSVAGGGTSTGSSAKAVLTDQNSHVQWFSCTKSATGQVIPDAVTTSPSPVRIGSLTKLSISTCVGPVITKVTASKLPYAVKVDSTTVSHQTDVIIAGIRIAVSLTGCSFTVTGSAPGYYRNTTHTLVMTPKLPIKPLNTTRLTVSNVAGCAGLVRNGDHATFNATYTLSPATLTIS